MRWMVMHGYPLATGGPGGAFPKGTRAPHSRRDRRLTKPLVGCGTRTLPAPSLWTRQLLERKPPRPQDLPLPVDERRQRRRCPSLEHAAVDHHRLLAIEQPLDIPGVEQR